MQSQLRLAIVVAELVLVIVVVGPAAAFVIVFVIYAGSDVLSSLNKFQYLIVLGEQCKRWIEYFPVRKITAVETCTTVIKYVNLVETVPQVVDGTAERAVSIVETSLKHVMSKKCCQSFKD